MVDPAGYCLSLAPEVEPFRREAEYVCDVIESWYPLQRSPRAKLVLHYGSRPPKGAIHVPAHLFPDGVVSGPDGLMPRRSDIDRIAGKLFPPSASRGSGRRIGYDAIGLVFLMLSRLEERGADKADGYGRFPHRAALATGVGVDREPVADRAADTIAGSLLGMKEPPRRTRYGVMLTHDVDRLRGYHRWHLPLRHALGDALKRGRPAEALARLRAAYFTGEPFGSTRALMDLGERHGIPGRFYFMGPSTHPMDSPYAKTMAATLRRAVDEIRGRGHIIGFHPGFGTAADPSRWLAQKDGLEAVVGGPVSEGRQHVLGYDAGATPDIWESAEMLLDTTLAWPELTGFRAGTCRPFPAYSLRQRTTLKLRQVCTAVMDFGLFGGRYRDLSMEVALEEARSAVAACRRYDGQLVMLYHTGQANDKRLARYFDDLLAEAA